MNEELYEKGLSLLREHTNEICIRVMKGRNEGRGNFAYLEDDDIVRERKIYSLLSHLLWRARLEFDGETDKDGLCNKKCYDCTYRRYRFHPKDAPNHWNWEDNEGWNCQAECECK